MGSLRVSCHPTQVNAPRLNPSQTGRYWIYLPRRDGKLRWPVGYYYSAIVVGSIPGRTPQKLPGPKTVTWSRVQRVDQEKHDWLGLLLRAHPCSGALPREHRNSGLKTGGALVLHQSSPRHKGSGQRLLLRRRRMNCASLVRWSNTSGKPLSVAKGGSVRWVSMRWP